MVEWGLLTIKFNGKNSRPPGGRIPRDRGHKLLDYHYLYKGVSNSVRDVCGGPRFGAIKKVSCGWQNRAWVQAEVFIPAFQFVMPTIFYSRPSSSFNLHRTERQLSPPKSSKRFLTQVRGFFWKSISQAYYLPSRIIHHIATFFTMAVNLSRPSAYARTPYCFQTNYGSDSYSGPSTSFHPSFETNGANYPPSHYNVNQYYSPFASDPRLRCSSSISSADWSNWKENIPERPSNLRSGSAAYDPSFLPLSAGEGDEASSSKW